MLEWWQVKKEILETSDRLCGLVRANVPDPGKAAKLCADIEKELRALLPSSNYPLYPGDKVLGMKLSAAKVHEINAARSERARSSCI